MIAQGNIPTVTTRLVVTDTGNSKGMVESISRSAIRSLALLLATLFAGCATSPLRDSGVAITDLTPAEALAGPARTGMTVIWGGRVVGVVNQDDRTELELVALPLGPGDRPRRQADEGPRFVIRQPGFLDPMTYAPGRFVTARGRFQGLEQRRAGGLPVQHPVLEAEKLELWPVNTTNTANNVRINSGSGVP